MAADDHKFGALRLKGVVQHYAWGRRGKSSLVAELAGISDPDKPCAELWFGSHGSGPCEVLVDSGACQSLADLIKACPEKMLAPKCATMAALPFLLKVLSIAEPLSIQCHPDARQAVILHQKDPLNYRDPCHKPEMAVALEEGELVAGFLPPQKILQNLELWPELKALFSQDILSRLNQEGDGLVLAALHKELLNAEQGLLKTTGERLAQKLVNQAHLSPEAAWLLKLIQRFPQGDVGVFHLAIMSYLRLSPGQAVSFMPGVLHAYLSGQWLECMASSDNTVRAGLTAKFIDRQTLMEICSYRSEGSPLLKAVGQASAFRSFSLPGVSEFRLEEYSAAFNGSCGGEALPSILFCLSGEAVIERQQEVVPLRGGQALFLPPDTRPFNFRVGAGFSFRALPELG